VRRRLPRRQELVPVWQTPSRLIINVNATTNKAVEDSRLCPHVQCIICLNSQTPLHKARLTAKGCQSARGNTDRDGVSASVLPLCAASHWLTSLHGKPHCTPHTPCHVKTWRHPHNQNYITYCKVRRTEQQPQVTKNFVKFVNGQGFLRQCERTDIQTHLPQYSAPLPGTK